ncbi:hypothetical protein DKX38_000642 [Salix brachista]|uniref:Uncharacterized protein n=1 Tax=Salix brachista TaxID=2182728 RepID=A0A5N5P2V7_9ROSI|nr:hypothetical protein DKX38_000642 [Salix brachista]
MSLKTVTIKPSDILPHWIMVTSLFLSVHACVNVCVFCSTFSCSLLPGISLNEEQWSALRKNIPAIEKAVKDMQDRDI